MNKEKQAYILNIAPIARLPLSKQQFFSYLCEQEVSMGALVLVPLFHREVQGVVLDCAPYAKKDQDYELKKITKVLAENFLTAKQILLAQQISTHYLTSLGVVLKHFLPKQVTARGNQNATYKTQNTKVVLTAEQESAVSAISNNDCNLKTENCKFLLYGPASSGKTEIYIHTILKMQEKDASLQFLILLPELTLTPQALQRYGVYFGKNELVILHSKLGKGEFYRAWQKIANGRARVIIATRIGVFAPFANLGAIFVDEEQDMSFKQWDASPRYDARKVATMLAENHQAKIVFGSATPRIESLYQTTIGKLKLVQIPLLPPEIMGRKKTVADIEIVDMRKEKWTDFAGKKKPNHSLLSIRLQDEISYALSQKMQTILFVNHQGLSTFSVCSSCKAVLKCPKCERALIENEDGIFQCLHCNFKETHAPSCKTCHSKTFSNVGIGTQLVEREIKKLFGNVKTARLDSAATKKAGALENIFNDFSTGKIDILIGTQMITKGWDNPNVILVAVIDSDSLFSSPDYLTDERAYINIMQIAGRTGRVGSRYTGHIILQTFNPGQKIFEAITSRNYSSFYQKEINSRSALKYPPLGSFIKLSFKNESEEKVLKETANVYAKISNLISQNNNISITEPSKPMISKIRGKFIMQMLLKNKQAQAPFPEEIESQIKALKSDWIVDVDPINIA
ncbi:MAG: primosomal protein N' [bacterium]